MAEVLVLGGGLGGLCTALLLADDGHHVIVVERDADNAPADPPEAWNLWSRRGVPQFRQLFYLLPRFRQLAERELPALAAALASCALHHDPLADVDPRDDGSDSELVALTARRPIVEAVVAQVAEHHPGVEVHRGVAVGGLVRGAATTPGAPHVVGVRTDRGELTGRLVIDATGRRSQLSRWLAEIGGAPLPHIVRGRGGRPGRRRHRGPARAGPPVGGSQRPGCG